MLEFNGLQLRPAIIQYNKVLKDAKFLLDPDQLIFSIEELLLLTDEESQELVEVA